MEYRFELTPVPKPRMTQSDKWNEREPVMRYRAYKEELVLKANLLKFSISTKFTVRFYIPFPNPLDLGSALELHETPHMKKPDIDNLLKGFMDALLDEDCSIYSVTAEKYWTMNKRGLIIVTI